MSLRHDGQTKPVGSLRVRARSHRLDTVSFNILHPGWHEAKLSLTDYPVQFDDDYYLSFHVAEQIHVLSIDGLQPNKYLNNAFAGASYFRLDHAGALGLNYSKFGTYQLIILNELSTISSGLAQELKTFAQNGGNVLVFPPQSANLASYNALLQHFDGGTLGGYEPVQRQASQINTDEYVFRDVYLNKSANLRLPITQGNFKIAPNRGEYLLTYRDGSALLAKYPAREGALYLCAASLDEKVNDLVRNGEIFVPMLFKMAVAGSKSRQIAYTIGKDEVLEAQHHAAASGEMVYKLKQIADGTKTNGSNTTPADPNNPVATNAEFIPEQRILGAKVLLTPGSQIRHSGWYQLQLRQDSTLAEYGFNYDRKESDLRYRADNQLNENLPKNIKVLSEDAKTGFAQVVNEQNQGIVLWRWCLVFALLFLALEVLFLRLWRV